MSQRARGDGSANAAPRTPSPTSSARSLARYPRPEYRPGRRLRIAQIAPPHIPLPPPGFGGSELVASVLTEELVRRGHAVTLFAHAASTTSAEFVPCPRRPSDFELHEVLHVARALEQAARFDIIHNHCLAAGPAFGSSCPVPMLSTLHYIKDIVRGFPEHPYVAISHAQRRLAEEEADDLHIVLNIVGVVHNGIDASQFPVVEHKADYLLYMGRMEPKKGPDIAVEVARRLGAELILAGPQPPVEAVDYFEEQIRPHLNGRISFVGEARGRQKVELLANARCVLVPSRWQEPFGVVAVEAMACGTPVVAAPHGALTEVVADGETGFLADSVEAMAAAVERAEEIVPARCRAWVEQHFTAARMADGYLAVYERLLSAGAGRRGLAS